MNSNPPQLPDNGTKVHRSLPALRILKYGMLTVITALLTILDYRSLTGTFPFEYAILFYGISVVALPLIIMALAETGMKITLDGHRLRASTFFTNDEILLTEIRGWKKGREVLYIFPDGYSLQPISIPMRGIAPAGLPEQLIAQYPEVNEDTRFIEGASAEQIMQRLKRAGREVYGLGAVTLLLSLLTINSGGASVWQMLLLLSCVPLSLLLLLRHKAFVQIFFEKERGRPSILFIWVIVLLSFSYVNKGFYAMYPWRLLPYTVATFFVLLVLQLVCYRKMRSAMRYLVVTILAGSLFFAIADEGVQYCNRALDTLQPQQFRVGIVAKFREAGARLDGPPYCFKLAPWGGMDMGRRLRVPESLYNSKHDGDDVQVYWHMGAFGSPWFTIGK